MVLFFVLAGASLDLDSFDVIWGISIAYIVLRTFSRVIGGWLGGALSEQIRLLCQNVRTGFRGH
jgi:Kef-type K+ transport system membrane component KefB